MSEPATTPSNVENVHTHLLKKGGAVQSISRDRARKLKKKVLLHPK